MPESVYATPQAMRQAIGDRLRQFTRTHPGTQLTDLQRQFAYDRLLSRVFTADHDRWVVKGATAMLARLGSIARHTRDIDLYREVGDLAEAEAALRTAAGLDLGDHFRFTLSPGGEVGEGQRALRIPADAYLGVTAFAKFHVDLVAGITMTGVPDEVPPLAAVQLPGLVQTSYRAYPIVDHIADKVCAMLERHPRLAGVAAESTRYRDLADLAVFAHNERLQAEALRRALTSESARRRLRLPANLPTPVGTGWRAGYARAARDAPGLAEQDLDSALALVRRLIDPALDGTAVGTWLTDELSWASPTAAPVQTADHRASETRPKSMSNQKEWTGLGTVECVQSGEYDLFAGPVDMPPNSAIHLRVPRDNTLYELANNSPTAPRAQTKEVQLAICGKATASSLLSIARGAPNPYQSGCDSMASRDPSPASIIPRPARLLREQADGVSKRRRRNAPAGADLYRPQVPLPDEAPQERAANRQLSGGFVHDDTGVPQSPALPGPRTAL